MDETNEELSIADEVREAFTERVNIGWQLYGGPPRPYNGMNYAKEAREEMLDGAQYLTVLMREVALLKAAAMEVVGMERARDITNLGWVKQWHEALHELERLAR